MSTSSLYDVCVGRERGQVVTSETFARIRMNYVRVLEMIVELPESDDLVGKND